MRFGVVRSESDRLLVPRRGLFELALLPEDDAQVAVRVGGVGSESDRLLKPLHGLFEFALAQ